MTTTELDPLIKHSSKPLRKPISPAHPASPAHSLSASLLSAYESWKTPSTSSQALSLLSAAGKQCVSLVMGPTMRRCGSDSTVVRTPTRSSLILFVRLMMPRVSSIMGLSNGEHHLPGCGCRCPRATEGRVQEPSQVWYCALFTDRDAPLSRASEDPGL